MTALGIRENAAQFGLLVLINGFVGGMVGLERAILPTLAEEEFGRVAAASVLAFLVVFGLTKAATNYGAGRLADRFGRKPILLAGWLVALPVPLVLMWAPTWGWVVGANALLGVSQGLTWSTAVIMKIDLAGPKQRGLAMGLNEFAGYLAVAGAAVASGFLAARYGVRPAPFLLGVGFALAGTLLTVLFVRETAGHVAAEQGGVMGTVPDSPFLEASFVDPTLSAASQAGFVNNLNDALAWGLFPIVFAAQGLDLAQIGLLAGLYPAVWGLGQLVTGAASDRYGRKRFIVVGMLVQAAGLLLVPASEGFAGYAASAVLMGLGTALVYPTLLAAVGDRAAASWRARAVGTYRLWRDSGYAAGAIAVGVLADRYGADVAIIAVAALTAMSGLVVAWRMRPDAPMMLAPSPVT